MLVSSGRHAGPEPSDSPLPFLQLNADVGRENRFESMYP
jgi:hypothetical protein